MAAKEHRPIHPKTLGLLSDLKKIGVQRVDITSEGLKPTPRKRNVVDLIDAHGLTLALQRCKFRKTKVYHGLEVGAFDLTSNTITRI